MKTFQPAWNASRHLARLWSTLEDGRIQCHLSPRNCIMKEGQPGFCRVRQNIGGRLVTLNYGRATQLTCESIETEAVFHYAPGARILSLGNIGCMMACDYCHNWKTSQAKFVSDKDVKIYTPGQVVDFAESQGIKILSWTYNDPVVWHEFVLDTAHLARQRGLRNLFKSAFYISVEAASELCDVIDIFSISIKTMDPDFYRKIAKGQLEPVLEATRYVHGRGKHLEISNLMVTDANDRVEDARAMASWVLNELSDTVPLHFVRFHPDYKYTHVPRTPVERLTRAREAAKEMGVRHCYLGNVYDHEGTNTKCRSCGTLLIERYGLNTRIKGLDGDGRCRNCGTSAEIAAFDWSEPPEEHVHAPLRARDEARSASFTWSNDINACHVAADNSAAHDCRLYYYRLLEDGREDGPYARSFRAKGEGRFILSKSAPDETGVRLAYGNGLDVRLFRVFDRAHYPTVDVALETAENPAIPQPMYRPGLTRSAPYEAGADTEL